MSIFHILFPLGHPAKRRSQISNLAGRQILPCYGGKRNASIQIARGEAAQDLDQWRNASKCQIE